MFVYITCFTHNYDAHRLAITFKFNHLTSWDKNIKSIVRTIPFVFFMDSTH